jgi:hypothetical protein
MFLLAINAPKIKKTFHISAAINKKNSFLPQISTNIDILPKYMAKLLLTVNIFCIFAASTK